MVHSGKTSYKTVLCHLQFSERQFRIIQLVRSETPVDSFFDERGDLLHGYIV